MQNPFFDQFFAFFEQLLPCPSNIYETWQRLYKSCNETTTTQQRNNQPRKNNKNNNNKNRHNNTTTPTTTTTTTDTTMKLQRNNNNNNNDDRHNNDTTTTTTKQQQQWTQQRHNNETTTTTTFFGNHRNTAVGSVRLSFIVASSFSESRKRMAAEELSLFTANLNVKVVPERFVYSVKFTNKLIVVSIICVL